MFTIARAAVFDGDTLLDGPHDVIVDDGTVQEVRPSTRTQGSVIDASGTTLLPGLIDAHVHSCLRGLEQTARFGVTTVLDMGSEPDVITELRRAAAGRPDVSDLRSAVTGLTHPNGHPHQLLGDLGNPSMPTVQKVDEIDAFVDARVAEGADYLKTWFEDGEVLGHPVTPIDPTLVNAFVAAGHARGLRVLVHALTRAATEQALASGADGLTHLFLDEPHTDALVSAIRDAGMHVVPTLTLLASLAGDPSAAVLADEPAVHAAADPDDLQTLCGTLSTVGADHLQNALATTLALHRAGVPIIAGSDSGPFPMPGLAYGASLHAELRLLVRAGLGTTDALAAATSVPADRFALGDRGRIAPGLRADLVLVDGDPIQRIDTTIAIRGVWRGGVHIVS